MIAAAFIAGIIAILVAVVCTTLIALKPRHDALHDGVDRLRAGASDLEGLHARGNR